MFGADLIEDNAVLGKGRVNWREDKMSVFGGDLVLLDLSEAGAASEEQPLVLLAVAERVDQAVVSKLKSTLLAHKGETPVHLKLVGQKRLRALQLPGQGQFHTDRRTERYSGDYGQYLMATMIRI